MHNVATTQCGTVSLRLSRHLIEGDRVAGDAVMHSIECYALYRVPTAQHLVNLMFVVVFRPSLSSGKKICQWQTRVLRLVAAASVQHRTAI